MIVFHDNNIISIVFYEILARFIDLRFRGETYLIDSLMNRNDSRVFKVQENRFGLTLGSLKKNNIEFPILMIFGYYKSNLLKYKCKYGKHADTETINSKIILISME